MIGIQIFFSGYFERCFTIRYLFFRFIPMQFILVLFESNLFELSFSTHFAHFFAYSFRFLQLSFSKLYQVSCSLALVNSSLVSVCFYSYQRILLHNFHYIVVFWDTFKLLFFTIISVCIESNFNLANLRVKFVWNFNCFHLLWFKMTLTKTWIVC
jgi:hypothetical protein